MENSNWFDQIVRKFTFSRIIACAMTVLFAVLVYTVWDNNGKFNPDKLASWFNSAGQANFARGLITFLVVLVTMIIALTLVFSLYWGEIEARKERFMLGKEILTIFVGILGTIMGFYYAEGTVGVGQIASLKEELTNTRPPRPTTKIESEATAEQVATLEANAIEAFLAMDYETASKLYSEAYSVSPTWRNIDEINKLLKSKADDFKTAGNDDLKKKELWKDLLCSVNKQQRTLGMTDSAKQVLAERVKTFGCG